MRLLFFIHSLQSGGAERVLSTLANYWAQKGWEAYIVTLAPEELDFYQLRPDIKRISLNLAGDSSGVFDAVKNNGKRIKNLRSCVKKLQPDIAISFMTSANCLLALATIGLQITVIGSERIYPPFHSVGKQWHFLRKYSYCFLNYAVALTEDNEKWLNQHTYVKHTAVIPNPIIYPLPRHSPIIDPVRFIQPYSFNYVMIAVGRLTTQKGFHKLIEVFAELNSRIDNWGLVILGEGELRSSLEQLIRQYNLENKVLMPGVVGNLGDWYQKADLFVLPSQYEGFPNTLVEAMAYGLPGVSFDCPTGPRDIIHHNINGCLVEHENTLLLHDSLYSLMTDHNKRHALGKQASEIKERLSIKVITQYWESLMQGRI